MRRAALASALAVVLVLAFTLAAVGRGGGGDADKAPRGSGPLAWAEQPILYTPETLPGDRILTGTLRNTGLRRLRVDLPDLRIRDAHGDAVAAQPIFLATFGKSLWSPARAPAQLPETELRRTGRLAWLAPGETVPFTLAWHAPAEPARIEYDGGWVPAK